MLKRFLSGLTSITMMLAIVGSTASITVYADDEDMPNDEDLISLSEEEAQRRAELILEDILLDTGDESNFITQALNQEFESGQGISGSGSLSGGNVSDPQWTPPYHTQIANMLFDDNLTSTNEGNNNLRKTCFRYGCLKADNPLLHNSSANQLHAIGNYIIHLEVMWKYTKLAPRLSHETPAANRLTTTTIKSQIKNGLHTYYSFDNLTSTEQSNINTLLDTVPEIFNLYIERLDDPDIDSYDDLSKLELKYLVFGLAMHLIGDIYAHKAFIPNTLVNRSNIDINDFYLSEYGQVISGIINGTIRGPQITNLMKQPSTAKYEDNIYYAPERYNASINASETFIENILISGNIFSYTYLDYSVDLQNVDAYIARYTG